MTRHLQVTELKPYVPAVDFELSKRFYSDLGFTLEWVGVDNSLACFRSNLTRFLLQPVGGTFRPDYLMMHLLVPDVQSWWDHVQEGRLAEKYKIKVEPPED